jgi:hypothetical protein
MNTNSWYMSQPVTFYCYRPSYVECRIVNRDTITRLKDNARFIMRHNLEVSRIEFISHGEKHIITR